MNLYEKTHEIHHNAETSKMGALLTSGTVSRQQWATYLRNQMYIREHLDVFLPLSLRKCPDLTMDLLSMGDVDLNIDYSKAAITLVGKTLDTHYLGAMLYIIGGANLRGGTVIRKTLEPLGFPCRHLHFERDDAAHADRWLKSVPRFARQRLKAQ